MRRIMPLNDYCVNPGDKPVPNPAETLRAIKTCEDLTSYLKDELDWPLEEYSFNELTFEYSPAELGL